MKRIYLVVGGVVFFGFFAVVWYGVLEQGWRQVFWGEPFAHDLTTICLEKKVVPDPDRYNGKKSICIDSKEIEVGTINAATDVAGVPTEIHLFGVKGENVFGVRILEAPDAPAKIAVDSIERVAVLP